MSGILSKIKETRMERPKHRHFDKRSKNAFNIDKQPNFKKYSWSRNVIILLGIRHFNNASTEFKIILY